MKKTLKHLIFVSFLLFLFFGYNQSFCYNSTPKILIINSNPNQKNIMKDFIKNYNHTFFKYSKAEIFYEDFFVTHTQKKKQLALTANLYEIKYPEIDLIIAIGSDTLKILNKYKELSKKKIPLIYIGKIGKESPLIKDKTYYYPFYLLQLKKELIKNIFLVQPDIKEIRIVYSNYFEKYNQISAFKYQKKYPLKELTAINKKQTEYAVILSEPLNKIHLNKKEKKKLFKYYPVYTTYQRDFKNSNFAIIGSFIFDVQKCAEESAKLSIRILDGEKPNELVKSQSFYYFALKKSAFKNFRLRIKKEQADFKLIDDNKEFKNELTLKIINYFIATIIILSILYFFYYKGKGRKIKNEKDEINFYQKTLNALSTPAFYTKKGIIKAINQKLLNIVDKNKMQIIGKKLKKASFYPKKENSLDESIRHYRINLENKTYIYEIFESKIPSSKVSDKELIVSFIDITERETLKKELHKKKQSLQITYEQSKEGIIEWDLSLNTINFSKGFYKLYKYNKDEIPNNIDDFISDFVHEDNRKNLKELLFKMKKNQIKSLECSLKILRKDKQYRDSLLKAESVVQNTKGENIFVLGMVIDIHEQKEFEENLKNSEANLSAVIDNSPRSIILLDQNLNIVLFNAMAQARMILLMGKSMQKDHAFLDYFNEDEGQNTLEEVLQDGLNGNFISFERELQDAQNNTAYFEFYIFPVVNKREHIQGVCVTIDDISYRKLFEKKITESEEKYRLLFKNMSSGFSYLKVTSNPDFEEPTKKVGLILSETNPALEEITGLSEASLLGENFESIFPELPIHQKLWENFFLNQNPLLNKLSIKEYYSNKYHKWFSFTFFKAKSGYLAAIIRDISRRKEDEAKVSNALSQKEMLLKEIHHRVKNNLQIIYGLFLMRSEKIQDESIKTILKECRNQIQSMALVHTKLYENENIDKVNLKSYIEDLSRSLGFSYALDRRNIEIIQEIDTILVSIDTAIPCGLLLNEALTNCIKHAFLEKESGKIELKIKKEDNNIYFSIKDNGEGLPKDFNLEKQKNISLGMDLIRMLTEQLKGELSISSDNGTKISVSFQLKEKDLR